MKKIITILSAITLFAIESVYSQAPQKFKYQAIARDNSGNVLANANVSFRISILQGSASGTSMYSETQTATTNQFGLANLNIGAGTFVSGNFSTIPWGTNTYYVKIEFDPAGGVSYTAMGTSQLLSVPYSLYSEKAGTSASDGDTTLWKKNGNNIFYNLGNVGIGATTTPQSKLQINIDGASAFGTGLRINQYQTGNSDGPKMEFYKTMTSPKSWSLGMLDGAGVDDFSINEDGGYGGYGTPRFTLLSGGNIGIGTTTPAARIDITSNSNFSGRVRAFNALHSGNNTFQIDQFGLTHATRPAWNIISASNADQSIGLVTDNQAAIDAGTSLSGLFIKSGGNVGIGTINPTSALSVGASSQFQVNSSGNIVKINNIATSFPSVQGAAATYLKNDGSGNLSWEAASTTIGGWGLTGNSSTTAGTNFIGTTDAIDWVVKTNNAERIRVLSTGNVGIGIASPANKLHIEGTGGGSAGIYMNSAVPSSVYYSLYNNNGILYWNGNAVSSIGSSISGATNYIPVFTSSSAIGNSTIYQSGTNLGIGTTTPASKLDVEGGISVGPTYSGTTASPDGAIIEGKVGIGTSTPASKLDVEGGVSIGASYSGSTASSPDGAIIEGRVGIGTTTPASMLDVEGGISVGSSYSGTSSAPSNGAIIEGNVGIGTISPQVKFQVDHDGSSTYGIGMRIKQYQIGYSDGPKLEFYKTMTSSKCWSIGMLNGVDADDFSISEDGGIAGFGTPRFIIANGGNVGIGVTAPASKLDVEGGVSIGSAYSGAIASPSDGAIIEGKVGIGTTTPASKLDVNGSVAIGSSYAGYTAAPSQGAIIEGNVGIGTSAPGYKLDVKGGNVNIESSDPFIKFKETGYGDVAGIFFNTGGGGNSNQLRFTAGGTNVDPPSQTQAMVINQSGTVGIGTTDPKSKLHVKGGDVYIEDVSNGIIIKSPNGACWRVTVDNTGAFVSQSISCP